MNKRPHQRALLITSRPGQDPDQGHELDALNQALKRGWRVAHATAMGGAGIGAQNSLPELCFAALVIIERDHDDAEELLAELEAAPETLLEEEPDMLLENRVEGDGNGTNPDVLNVEIQANPPIPRPSGSQ